MSNLLINLDEATEYFNENILPLLPEIIQNSIKYQLVITGCIGSGKTTLLKQLIKLFKDFNPIIINEYLEANKTLGPSILSGFINKEISSLTMQNCILDIYENELKNIKITNVNSGIIFYERIPDDNLAVFSNLAYSSRELTSREFNVLFTRTIDIDKKYNIPSYINKNSEFKRIVSTDLLDSILIILQTIKDDIKHGVKSRIIGLSASLEICKLRIKRRKRNDEDKYDDKYLQGIINTYNNIYNLIEKGNDNYKITLYTIGRFTE